MVGCEELILEKNDEEEEGLFQCKQEEIIEKESLVIGDKINEVVNQPEAEGKNEEIMEIGSNYIDVLVNDEKLEVKKDDNDINEEKLEQIDERAVINIEKVEDKADKQIQSQNEMIAENDEADEHKEEDLDIDKVNYKADSKAISFEESSYEEHKVFEPEAKPIEMPLENIEQPKYNEQAEKIDEIHIETNTNGLSYNDSEMNPLIKKNAGLLEEREEKIKSIKNRFSPQITNLENQMKASKGKGLIFKLLEKIILEQQKQINQINLEYENLLNFN